jgi:hypothetical protein
MGRSMPAIDFMASVAFDTPYSAETNHAELVAQLGAWLDDRNVRWAWSIDGDDTVRYGLDDLVLLDDCSFLS